MTSTETKTYGALRVEEWNEACPPGTLVSVKKNDGGTFNTKTRSEAWMLGADGDSPGHTPVVLLEGISGAYRLSRCNPIKISRGGAAADLAKGGV